MPKKAILVAGLGFGDEGKGSIVDYLTRREKAHTVIRYNGGAQAAHNVVTSDGRHHTFAQFGSGTLVPGVKTHLSRFVVVNPLSMLVEEEYLEKLGIRDAFERTTIDANALVVTPFQKAINRLSELARGEKRYGSCGMGIGETMDDAVKDTFSVLRVKDLVSSKLTREKLQIFQRRKLEAVQRLNLPPRQDPLVAKELKILQDPQVIEICTDAYQQFTKQVKVVGEDYVSGLLREDGVVIFEGAQGVLLDLSYGLYPHVTKTNTTLRNAETILTEANYKGEAVKIGVLRGYHTRHGAGPLVTEDETLLGPLADEHHAPNTWQGSLRIGHFDLVLAYYALTVISMPATIDQLAITNLDRMIGLPEVKICIGYDTARIENDLFEYVNGCAMRIKVYSNDIVARERITAAMNEAKPTYKILPPSEKLRISDYAGVLEELLGIPIKIVSFGPTADDKESR